MVGSTPIKIKFGEMPYKLERVYFEGPGLLISALHIVCCGHQMIMVISSTFKTIYSLMANN